MGPQFLEYECNFGRKAGPFPEYISGWSVPEDGWTWAVGHRAELSIPDLAPSPAFLLEISVSPLVNADFRRRQTIVTYVNGTAISAVSVREFSVLAFMVPGALVSSGCVRIQFGMPDAFRPRDIPGAASDDGRILGFAFSRLRVFRVGEPVKPPTIADPGDAPFSAFESIGDNCDFGLLQRAAGLEPLGLLRFSRQPPRLLIAGLDEAFESVNDVDAVSIHRGQNGDYDIFVRPYMMFYHPNVDTIHADESKIIAQQYTRLKFLTRKFMEDVKNGEKIFVYRRASYLRDAEILAIHAAINRIGNVNMLAVREADEAHPAGSIDVLMPGLFCGYVGKLRDEGTVGLPCPDDWHTICQETLNMVSGRRDRRENHAILR